MNVVDLGSKNCQKRTNQFGWFFPNSWDDGQNCVPGCISRMNQYKQEEACCDAERKQEGTVCAVIFNSSLLIDTVPGDDDSSTRKAVKCNSTLGLFSSSGMKIKLIGILG